MKSNGRTLTSNAESPGATIRALRLSKGLTLAQVGEKTGLAVSTLSKLEIGSVSLSYDKLMLISKGLGVDMASLVDPKPQVARGTGLAAGRRTIQRAGEGQLVETRSYRQTYLATDLLNKKMTPMFVEIRARTLEEFSKEFGGLIHHPGEEFTFVVEGELDFHSEHYAPVRLRAGDSVYFDSEMGHAYLKASDEPCRLVCSCAPRGEGEERLADMFVKVSNRNSERAKSTSAKATPAPKERQKGKSTASQKG
jgi:transcriptional regulator with XRE-family HTH domain